MRCECATSQVRVLLVAARITVVSTAATERQVRAVRAGATHMSRTNANYNSSRVPRSRATSTSPNETLKPTLAKHGRGYHQHASELDSTARERARPMHARSLERALLLPAHHPAKLAPKSLNQCRGSGGHEFIRTPLLDLGKISCERIEGNAQCHDAGARPCTVSPSQRPKCDTARDLGAQPPDARNVVRPGSS